MTEPQKSETVAESPTQTTGKSPSRSNEQAKILPGMAVICLWMLGLCGLGLIGVITHNLPPGVMILCVIFAIAANGLLKLKRWGWALTLAAAFLSMSYGTYMLFRFHQGPMIVMVAVNLIFFLYLIRPEVLERVK
jgi:Predicted membrane protein (DUF2127)